MLAFMDKYKAETYALLRIVTGFLFAFHGYQKLFNYQMPMVIEVGTLPWIGGLIELTGGILVLTGWQTRLAAFICSGEMAVAYIQFHWKGQMGAEFLPGVNHGEPAVMYCFTFLYMAARGAGIWSVDKNS